MCAGGFEGLKAAAEIRLGNAVCKQNKNRVISIYLHGFRFSGKQNYKKARVLRFYLLHCYCLVNIIV